MGRNAAFHDMKRGIVALMAGTALTHAPAFAQADTIPAEGDIIVTANKRAESLDRVGMSITAVSGEALKERQVTSLEDVAALVPGLSYSASTSNTPIFTLRGIGFNENSLGVYPAVSVYLDQAPLPFPVLASHTAFDLERVEVLKGPQGTLFGQNSTGGAINYIAAKPTSTLTAGGDIGFGRFNQFSGNFYVSGPITDTLKFRIAATGLRQDAWQRSLTRPDDTNGKRDYFAYRLLLDWQPTDRIKVAFNFNGWKDRSDPQAQQLIAKRPSPVYGPEVILDQFRTAPFAGRNARDADWSALVFDPATGQTADFSPFSDRRFYQLSLRTDIELTDDLTFTSLTTYDDFRQEQSTDGDGLALANFDLPSVDGTLTSFNQEMRLANAQSNRLRWILGANYEHSKTSEFQDDRYIQNPANSAGNLFINGSADLNQQRIENWAVFGNGEFDVTDKLTLLAGMRYTKSRIADYNCGYALPGYRTDILFNFLGDIFGTVPFTPVGTGPGQCYTLDSNFVPGTPYRTTLREDNVSWRAGLNYKLSNETLIYGNVSRGFKAGSFPSLAASTYRSLQPVTQEQVTAYEVGFKTSLFDRMARISAAAFYYDYRDKQVRGRVIDTPNLFGPIDALVNVPKSRIWGLEAAVSLRPVKGLTIALEGTHLNSKVLDYNGFNLLGTFESFRGDALPYTPRWSGSINVDYEFRAGSGMPFMGVTLSGRSASDAAMGGSRILWPLNEVDASVAPGITYVYRVEGYATVDARLGYRADSGWKAYAWVKNLTDKYYYTSIIASAETATRFAAMPRTFGVTISYDFK